MGPLDQDPARTGFNAIERYLPPLTDDRASRRQRGREFERLCLWLLGRDPVLAAEVRRVWAWDEWPDRSGADHGIDIVVEGRDGLWAVQCKADHPDRAVAKREIDSFLSAAGRRFVRRILFSTSDRLAPNARRAVAEHGVIFYGPSALRESGVDWDSYGSGTTIKRRPLGPKPHQQIAIAKVTSALRHGGRGQVHMPCGTGKTLVAQRVAENLQARHVVVVVPTLGLLAQTLRSWAANTTRVYRALAVCSDDGVTGDEETLESYEIPAARTADPAVISDFLSDTGEPRVVFATYQSASSLLQRAQALGAPAIDLLIADEAHRLVGGGTFAGVLDDRKVLAMRRLLLTATPRIFDASSRAGDELRELSMDNEELYGPVAFAMSFREAIELDLLADYDVVVLLVGDTHAADLVRQRRNLIVAGTSDPNTPARDMACAVALLHGAGKHGIRTAVAFHSSVNGARRFPQLLMFAAQHSVVLGVEAHEVWARSITGRDPARQRAQLLAELVHPRRSFGLVSNARCLAEGVDVPALDAVAFVDPRYSQVDIIQAVGRAIRRHPAKGTGKIVIPVPVSSASAHGEIERTEFHAVYRVLRALRAHDQSLAEQLDASQTRLMTGKSYTLPSRVAIDVSLLPDVLASGFLKAFQPIVLEETSDAWVVRYQHLLNWVADKSNTALTGRLSGMPKNLRRWVAKQRSHYHTGRLPLDRQHLLEQVPGWAWDADDAEWDHNFRALVAFHDARGHLPMNRRDTFDGRNVGMWLTKQRAAGRGNTMSAHRRAKLESLPGFAFFQRDERFWRSHAAYRKWAMDKTPEQLLRGPKTGELVDDVDLPGWTDNMRLRRRVKQTAGNDVPQWQLAAMDDLPGWRWESDQRERDEAAFRRRVEIVRSYCEEAGRNVADIVVSLEWRGERIGQWINGWRSARDRIPEHRCHLLQALPGWTWCKNNDDELWEAKLAELAAFGKRRGHVKPSIKAPTEDGEKELGVWKRNTKHRLRNEDSDRARRFFALLAEHSERR